MDTTIDEDVPLSAVPTGNFLEQEPDPAHVKGIKKITWLTLKDVEFKDTYYEKEDQYFLHPTYGEKLQALADQKVYISGYVIPIDPDSNISFYRPIRSALVSFVGMQVLNLLLNLSSWITKPCTRPISGRPSKEYLN